MPNCVLVLEMYWCIRRKLTPDPAQRIHLRPLHLLKAQENYVLFQGRPSGQAPKVHQKQGTEERPCNALQFLIPSSNEFLSLFYSK